LYTGGYSNQHAFCTILGVWLVSVAGYSIALGTYSVQGWVLTSLSMAVAKSAINWGEFIFGMPLPSVPKMLDALLFLGIAGWVAAVIELITQRVKRFRSSRHNG
jgi:CHASE2 domain-containing sensor protein